MLKTTTSAIVALALSSAMACAEIAELKIDRLPGLSYLPLILMEEEKLVEKQLSSLGRPAVKVSWVGLGAANVANDALLAGDLHILSGGVPAFATLWARTRGGLDVRGVMGLNAMPLYLNTRNANVRTIRDFTEKDRIALPAVKVSAQSIILQMAAEQEFGAGHHYKLDPLTVSLPHPDGMTALLSGASEITSHFTSPPFQYQQLEKPGIRRVLSSYDVLGGAGQFTLVYTSAKFRSENPSVFAAFSRALVEALGAINADKRRAAETFVKVAKGTTVESVLKMLEDPEISFSPVPRNMMKQVDFMHRIGSIKARPDTWRDLFFPEAQGMPGS